MKNSLRKAIVLCLSFIPLSVKADYYEMMQEDNYGYGDTGGNNNITLAEIGLSLLAFVGAMLIYIAIQFAIDNKKIQMGYYFLVSRCSDSLMLFLFPVEDDIIRIYGVDTSIVYIFDLPLRP